MQKMNVRRFAQELFVPGLKEREAALKRSRDAFEEDQRTLEGSRRALDKERSEWRQEKEKQRRRLESDRVELQCTVQRLVDKGIDEKERAMNARWEREFEAERQQILKNRRETERDLEEARAQLDKEKEETRSALAREREQWEETRRRCTEMAASAKEVVKLSVGGIPFAITKTIIDAHPGSLLACMLSHEGFFKSDRDNDDGTYFFFDRDPKAFEFLLQYMRTGVVAEHETGELTTAFRQRIVDEAKYFGLDRLEKYLATETIRLRESKWVWPAGGKWLATGCIEKKIRINTLRGECSIGIAAKDTLLDKGQWTCISWCSSGRDIHEAPKENTHGAPFAARDVIKVTFHIDSRQLIFERNENVIADFSTEDKFRRRTEFCLLVRLRRGDALDATILDS